MNHLLKPLTIILVASVAYGQGQTLNKPLMHGGISRSYTIYVPSGYTSESETPLVVNMHGLTLNRNFQMTQSGMNTVAEREGFLVVYPDAVNSDWFGPHDNIGFIDRLLDDVSSQYSVNASKVYATGFSQGGMMSYLLSVERPDQFAAIASIGGTRPFANGVLYPPGIEALPDRPFPLLHIHGTSDPLVPYNGGVGPPVGGYSFSFPPVERVVSDYVANNGGDSTPTVVELPNINTADGTTVRRTSYEGDGYLDSAGQLRATEVLLYRVQNGGHNWPGDSTGWPGWASPVNYDISASNEIWSFFSRHEAPLVPTWNVDTSGVWSLLANWNGAVPNAPAARAAFADVITAPRTVTLDDPITLGRLEFDSSSSYTIAGPNVLAIDAANGKAQINVARGSHTIGARLHLIDNTEIGVSPADSTLTMTAGVNAPNVNIEKTGAGTLAVNHLLAEGLSINAGKVEITPVAGAPGASVLGGLAIAGATAPTATLDLTTGAIVIDYTGTSPAATIHQQILSGRGGSGLGADWNGMGITSSAAAPANTTEPESRSIGYAENGILPLGPYTSFRGQAVDDTTLLMAFTRTGDANLDGVVNDEDVTIVGATYAPGVAQPHWALGDFDYNGFVDDVDVTLLSMFYDPAATPIAMAAALSQPAAVPEPASFLLLASGFAVMLIIASRIAKPYEKTFRAIQNKRDVPQGGRTSPGNS